MCTLTKKGACINLCTHAHDSHAHTCISICIYSCMGASSKQCCKQRLILYIPHIHSASTLPFRFLRFLHPQLWDVEELLAVLFGAVGSGHRRLPQAADASVDPLEDVKGKPGSGKSSGLSLVDFGYVYFMLWFVLLVCCIAFHV